MVSLGGAWLAQFAEGTPRVNPVEVRFKLLVLLLLVLLLLRWGVKGGVGGSCGGKRIIILIETKKHSRNTGARENNTLHK